MIYPSTTGKAAGNEMRLRTLEAVWVQGKLKMWGRWASYSDTPEAVNMFRRLLSRNSITQDDLSKAIKFLRKSGCSNNDLEAWMNLMLKETTKSSLVFCSDDEGMLLNKAIGSTLINHPGLLDVLKQRYLGRGMKKSEMAVLLNERFPGWCYRTCQRRIDSWLSIAEYLLYLPVTDAFELNADRFLLPAVLKSG